MLINIKQLKKKLKLPKLTREACHWLIISGACLVAIIMILAFYFYTNKQTEIIWFGDKPVGVEQEEVVRLPVAFSHLTGIGVYEASEAIPEVLGIVIDNHWSSRPQSGLNDAGVIYEVPVEGGITRFLAIFAKEKSVKAVGPIRSARPYFLDWLAEYDDPLFLHCGGSEEALRLLKVYNVFDVNEFYFSEYFWRDKQKIAPHNLYTNSEDWQKIFVKYGDKHSGKNWEGWLFSEDKINGEAVKEINVKYTTDFKSGWKFDEVMGNYQRIFNDEVAKDSVDTSIVVDNIVIQYMGVKVLDEVGRLKIYDIGTGDVLILRDGQMVHGSWEKKSMSERTRFYNEVGEEIPLKPGRTWVMIVPDYLSAEVGV
jgi:hypothetical protein